MYAGRTVLGMMHLSEYMTANGLDDDNVAAAISRSRVTVSRIRRRKVRPDWDTIGKISAFTNGVCTADDFQSLDETSDEADAPAESAA